MKHLFFTFTILAFAIISSTSSVLAASEKETKMCIKMIEDMIGVEPSEEVIKLCEDGKSDEAMEEAMSGG